MIGASCYRLFFGRCFRSCLYKLWTPWFLMLSTVLDKANFFEDSDAVNVNALRPRFPFLRSSSPRYLKQAGPFANHNVRSLVSSDWTSERWKLEMFQNWTTPKFSFFPVKFRNHSGKIFHKWKIWLLRATMTIHINAFLRYFYFC